MENFYTFIDNSTLCEGHKVYICSMNKGRYAVNPNQPSTLTKEQVFLLNSNDFNFCFWTKQEMNEFINLKNNEIERMQNEH